jgi:hypothetical protein
VRATLFGAYSPWLIPIAVYLLARFKLSRPYIGYLASAVVALLFDYLENWSIYRIMKGFPLVQKWIFIGRFANLFKFLSIFLLLVWILLDYLGQWFLQDRIKPVGAQVKGKKSY